MGEPNSEIPIPNSACGLVGEDATLIQWKSLVRIQPGRPRLSVLDYGSQFEVPVNPDHDRIVMGLSNAGSSSTTQGNARPSKEGQVSHRDC